MRVIKTRRRPVSQPLWTAIVGADARVAPAVRAASEMGALLIGYAETRPDPATAIAGAADFPGEDGQGRSVLSAARAAGACAGLCTGCLSVWNCNRAGRIEPGARWDTRLNGALDPPVPQADRRDQDGRMAA